MRYVLLTALVGAIACGGCEKKQGPQTTDPNVPVETAGTLAPLEPPPAEPAIPPSVEPEPLTTYPPAPAPEFVPAPEPLAAAPSPAPERTRTYVVQKGDTLWRIALTILGDGQRYRDILAANPGVEPHSLQIGQRLVIPSP
jgi:nucleoid-associated protein YgaU